MEIVTATSGVKLMGSVLALAKELTALIKRAQSATDLQQRVALYLRAAQDAINGLGTERQQILTDARRCSLEDAAQVKALWKRMDTYLFEDHIRPKLQDAVDGLLGCNTSIMAESEKFSWRNKHNKRDAATNFTNTVTELEEVLNRLPQESYPGSKRSRGGSGMGAVTLIPIYDLIEKLQDTHKQKAAIDYDSEYERLGDLLLKALRHPSHEDWMRSSGQIERLITELHLAFRWNERLTARAVPGTHSAAHPPPQPNPGRREKPPGKRKRSRVTRPDRQSNQEIS